ncbi:hypothetical protein GT347_23305 [Xylophilus rhododendri]|uniref:Uncharacterized protein n=1 Tax=Xylophilus rhododendri TaxID=2697032 RepID=A0A857JCG4_9BURK|nr:hypothetical protein [Xylophilus rhododendri]QHJ00653.1 hypothetical protein GT347_23305 [Xylophilus rhododendri]
MAFPSYFSARASWTPPSPDASFDAGDFERSASLHADPGGGRLLDGMPRREPLVELSCCELLLSSVFGCDPHDTADIHARYRRLIETCRRLPRTAHEWQSLSQRLERLYRDIKVLKCGTFAPARRSELRDELGRLCGEADTILRKLSRKQWTQQYKEISRQQNTLSPVPQRVAPALYSSNSSLNSDPPDRPESPEPAAPPRQGRVRRRDRPAAFQRPAPLPVVEPANRSSFEMTGQRIAAMQDAIREAWETTDGKSRLKGEDAVDFHLRMRQVADIGQRHVIFHAQELRDRLVPLHAALKTVLRSMPDAPRRAIEPLALQYLASLEQ